MRILIFHGYLLRGTGSNVYNANLAQALARLGHEVHLLCQDRGAAELPWVDAVGRWEAGGELRVAAAGEASRARHRGSVTAYVPDIGGLLPTYVPDSYEGFRSRTFPELSDAEVERYIDANVAAVRDVAKRAGGVEAALANHLVMGPVILARCGLSFAAKIHGSALSYTVMPHRRFLPLAREGMAAARAVLVGSRHTGASLWETLRQGGLEEKTRLGPPGVDVDAFSPLLERSSATELEALAEEIDTAPAGLSAGFGRNRALAASGLRRYATADGPRVVFVGKLIVSKGCDLLLAAWPLVARSHPGARLVVIGFGAYAETLLRLWSALGAGDISTVVAIAASGRAPEGGEEGSLGYLKAFVDDPPAGYVEAARDAADTVDWVGRLEYEEVAHVVRASDAAVVPSTFPEAFGMVAAEAAATGALPVCAHHSGLAEVAGALAAALPAAIAPLTSFELGPGAIPAIADRLNRWLELPAAERERARAALVATVRGCWSWERVARAVIDASVGDLDALDPVPSG